MSRTQRILNVAAAALAVTAAGAALAGASPAAEGRALVERGAAAHGGHARFRALGVVAARIEDAWSWPGRWWSDWPANPARGTVRFDFAGAEARVAFDAPAGLVWGFDGVGGWAARGDVREPDPEAEEAASYMLRTVGYYWTMPFRFLEPGARYRALGIQEDLGEAWNAVEIAFADRPERPGDVFTAYYNLATGCLHHVHLTSRERSRFTRGLVRYDAYTRSEGILWPADIGISLTAPVPLDLHRLRFAEIRREPGFDRRLFEKPDARAPEETAR